jgi:hypothetical protein
MRTEDQKKKVALGPSPRVRATMTVLRNWKPAPIMRTAEGSRVCRILSHRYEVGRDRAKTRRAEE